MAAEQVKSGESGDEIRAAVRERYGRAAEEVGATAATDMGTDMGTDTADDRDGCGCGPGCGGGASPEREPPEFGASQYAGSAQVDLPGEAALSSLGCGNPTAVAELAAGEVVLDLGSGGGLDVLLSARRVGPTGKAYGLDMTDEMLQLARENQRRSGVGNAEFLKGTIEEVPLHDASVDVVISNCVINLSADKPSALREAYRVLRPGGRLAVTDIVADPWMDAATRHDMEQWTGCIAGALTEDDFRRELDGAGFEEIEIRETHRVHEQAGSAIVRARKPLP